MSLSDYDRMVKERLPNWAFCGKQDRCRPDPEAGSATIYEMGRSLEVPTIVTYRCGACRTYQPDEGRCNICGLVLIRHEERISPEPPPPPPNFQDAEWLDKLIGNKLARTHRRVLLRYYGSFYRKPDHTCYHELPAAVRALLDIEYLAKELGWAA